MRVLCKKSYHGFEKGNSYEVIQISSVFEPDDFITIKSDESLEHSWYRFRMNNSTQYVEDYIGENEAHYHDYFVNIKEERKNKLEKLSSVTEL
jgi:uncharacterized protein YfdQ (DUF2303 family)